MTKINRRKLSNIYLGMMAIVALLMPMTNAGINLAPANAISAPDTTDYVSIWKLIDEEMRENQKQIVNDELQLKEMQSTMSPSDISATEKRISDNKVTNEKLWKQKDEIEKLNIKSYQLDPETKEKFVNAEQKLNDKYLNEKSGTYVGPNGVQIVYSDYKQREIVVVVDVTKEMRSSENPANVIQSIASEIKSTVNDVNVTVEFGKSELVACTSRTSVCNPAKGGVQIERQNSGGSGSTMSFKATHSTYGAGFVIAGHEAVAVENKIVQPKLGSVIGTVKAYFSSLCDCAFVKLDNPVSWPVENKIYAPEVGSTYPINIRVGASSQIPGTILNLSGVGSGVKIGQIISVGPSGVILGTSVVTGDSGAPVYKPLVSGSADVYGEIIQNLPNNRSLYEPWDKIKSTLSLTD